MVQKSCTVSLALQNVITQWETWEEIWFSSVYPVSEISLDIRHTERKALRFFDCERHHCKSTAFRRLERKEKLETDPSTASPGVGGGWRRRVLEQNFSDPPAPPARASQWCTDFQRHSPEQWLSLTACHFPLTSFALSTPSKLRATYSSLTVREQTPHLWKYSHYFSNNWYMESLDFTSKMKSGIKRLFPRCWKWHLATLKQCEVGAFYFQNVPFCFVLCFRAIDHHASCPSLALYLGVSLSRAQRIMWCWNESPDSCMQTSFWIFWNVFKTAGC